MIAKIKTLILPTKGHSQDLLSDFQLNYQATQNFIRNVIYWMIRSDDVDDLVQDTYVKAWKSYIHFKRESSFKSWVYKIAINTTYDYLRSQKKHLQEEYKEQVTTQTNNELRDLINRGLAVLTPLQREVFILFYKLDYTSSEISDLLNIAEGTVKSRLHHARNTFKNYLQQNGISYAR